MSFCSLRGGLRQNMEEGRSPYEQRHQDSSSSLCDNIFQSENIITLKVYRETIM